MKKLFLYTIFLIVSFECKAQLPVFQWAKGIGSTLVIPYSHVLDASENVYVTGLFSGTVDFDPNQGVQNITSNGGWDIFISKFDASGNFLWTKNLGGTANDIGYSIAVDGAGNVYSTGEFKGTADFDPGVGVYNLSSAGDRDIFVSKLDPSGNFMWAKQFAGTMLDVGHGIALDNLGNVYTTGQFEGTVDFDPGPGTANLTSAGGQDIFVSKLDASGNYTWVKRMGGSSSLDEAFGIALDQANNIYTTGVFSATADFDPGPGIANLVSSGNYEVFISKLDASGNYVWAKKMGGAGFDEGNSIQTDASGNVFITGYFSGTADFDPGPGIYNLTSLGNSDIFISKLDMTGNFIWGKGIGGTGQDEGMSIALDPIGNVYTTGYFMRTVDFDPGVGTYNLTSPDPNTWDIFISKLDSAGSFVWTVSMGSIYDDYPYSIAVSPTGNVYTNGVFYGTVDFDPGPGVFNLTGNQMYIHKMDQCFPVALSQNITLCAGQQIMVGNNAYNVNGIYHDTLLAVTGCDSVIITHLTVNAAITVSQNISLCGGQSISVGNNTYNTTGVYVDTLQAVNSCDSTVTTNLTVNPTFNTPQNIILCNGQSVVVGMSTYTTSGLYADTLSATTGCDSIIITNLRVDPTFSIFQNITLCPGQSIIVGVNTYTMTGIYTDLLTSVKGCDSNVTTNLTINNLIIGSQNIVLCAGQVITIGMHTYFTSGVYMDTINIVNGCDSVITTNLTVNPAITASQNIALCAGQSIIVGPNTYNSTGTYTDILPAANGCDSTVTTNLTISPFINTSQTITLCGGQNVVVGINTYSTTGIYSDTIPAVNGCDSIITTNLTVDPVIATLQTISLCGGQSINVGQNTYNATGVYADLLSAANGCDSNVTTNLIVYPAIDITTTVSGISINANQTGATYQWIDCNNANAPIAGAINQLYTAAANGDYAVIVTLNNCTDTSACVNITGMGIRENKTENDIAIYPNPTSGLFIIKSSDRGRVHITNVLGQTVVEQPVEKGIQYIDLGNESRGLYFITVITSEKRETAILIKL